MARRTRAEHGRESRVVPISAKLILFVLLSECNRKTTKANTFLKDLISNFRVSHRSNILTNCKSCESTHIKASPAA